MNEKNKIEISCATCDIANECRLTDGVCSDYAFRYWRPKQTDPEPVPCSGCEKPFMSHWVQAEDAPAVVIRACSTCEAMAPCVVAPRNSCSTCSKNLGECDIDLVAGWTLTGCAHYEPRTRDKCYRPGCTDHSLWSCPKSAAGGRKDDSGKLRWGIVPIEPLERIVEVFNFGAEKYGDRNWEKGIAWLKVWEAAMRHLCAWRKGEDLDPESGLPHLSHAAWGCLALIEYARTKREFDDRAK